MGLLQSLIGRVPLHQLVNKFEYPLAVGSPPPAAPQPQPQPHQMRFNGQQANTLGQGGGSQQFPSIHQGGQFNPGYIPMQNSSIGQPNDGGVGYGSTMQPAAGYRFQGSQYNPHRPGIFF